MPLPIESCPKPSEAQRVAAWAWLIALAALSLFGIFGSSVQASSGPGPKSTGPKSTGPHSMDIGSMARRLSSASSRDLSVGAKPDNRAGKKDARDKEYRVKAALLFNFLKYATFPKGTFKSKKEAITILIIGDDPFGPILEKSLRKKEIDGRSIRIMRAKTLPKNPQKSLGAHLIFAAGLSDADTLKLIAASQDKPCLVVSDDEGFADKGGFIHFDRKEGKIKFTINIERQEDTGVTLRAALLKLARVVEPSKEKDALKKDSDKKNAKKKNVSKKKSETGQ